MTTRRVLITGSRKWSDRETIGNALLDATKGTHVGKVTVVQGACPYGGADLIAAQLAHAFGMEVEEHPADWDQHGKAAGPLRNQEMVDLGADVCLAFPLSDSRGTWDCVRRAEAAGIEVRIFTASEATK